jgi:hypothetical protein
LALSYTFGEGLPTSPKQLTAGLQESRIGAICSSTTVRRFDFTDARWGMLENRSGVSSPMHISVSQKLHGTVRPVQVDGM